MHVSQMNEEAPDAIEILTCAEWAVLGRYLWAPLHHQGQSLDMMKAKGTFLVPTVGVIDAYFERSKNDPMTTKRCSE
jgi:hypothetical protein